MKTLILATAVAALIAPLPAHAINDFVLITNDPLQNVALLEVEGIGNVLRIDQQHGGGAANTVTLNIRGDFNGGAPGASFTGAALLPGLQPGSLVQRGNGNSMSFDVIGSHNLFAASQIGDSNIITGSISGSYNQASVMQAGNNNFVGFSQTGFNNTISVSQTSW